jgi:hypothetical protein
MADHPLWRQGFDAIERRLAGPVEGAVQTDLFADVVALGVRAQRRAQREVERRTRRVLHMVNVPTATDVRRVSEQLADLQRQVRELERVEPRAPVRTARGRDTARPRS